MKLLKYRVKLNRICVATSTISGRHYQFTSATNNLLLNDIIYKRWCRYRGIAQCLS